MCGCVCVDAPTLYSLFRASFSGETTELVRSIIPCEDGKVAKIRQNIFLKALTRARVVIMNLGLEFVWAPLTSKCKYTLLKPSVTFLTCELTGQWIDQSKDFLSSQITYRSVYCYQAVHFSAASRGLVLFHYS